MGSMHNLGRVINQSSHPTRVLGFLREVDAKRQKVSKSHTSTLSDEQQQMLEPAPPPTKVFKQLMPGRGGGTD